MLLLLIFQIKIYFQLLLEFDVLAALIGKSIFQK